MAPIKRVIFLCILLCTVSALSAQISTDTKDVQIARQKLRVGQDTSKYFTSTTNVVDAGATHRALPTAKAVWDALSAIPTTVSTNATLTGDGSGGSPLGIAQQSATSGQVLKWTGTTWAPAADDGTSYTAGTGIDVTGTVISNTAPDQTVSITGGGINSISGTYPNFTVTGTEVDGSVTNEIQTISYSAPNLTLSGGGGSVAIPQGTIGGSGTINYVPKFTPDGTTLGNSQVFDNGTNVGVRTTSPAAALHVIGTAATSASWTAQFHNSSGNNNGLLVRNDGYLMSGTNSPQAKYHFNTNTTGTYEEVFVINNSSDPGAGATRFRVKNSASNLVFTAYGSGAPGSLASAGAFVLDAGSNMTFLTGPSSADINFAITDYVNPILKIKHFTTIDRRVGIQESSPLASLHVKGGGTDNTTKTFYVKNRTGSDLFVVNDGGQTGVNTASPAQTLHVNGTMRLATPTGTPTTLIGRDGNGDVGTAGAAAIIAAGGVTSNLYTANGTISGTRTVTTVNNALIFDASTASSTISTPFAIKGKADGTNSTQGITFQDAASSTKGYISYTNTAVTLGAASGHSLVLAAGVTGWTIADNGHIKPNQTNSTDPTVTSIHGALWYNTTTSRYKYNKATSGTTPRQIANVEDDIVGSTILSTSSTYTITGTEFRVQLDANTNSITVTADGTMQEGYTYLVRCRRNNINSIVINSGGGYSLAIDGDATLSPTTYNCAAYEILKLTRYDTVIFVDK